MEVSENPVDFADLKTRPSLWAAFEFMAFRQLGRSRMTGSTLKWGEMNALGKRAEPLGECFPPEHHPFQLEKIKKEEFVLALKPLRVNHVPTLLWPEEAAKLLYHGRRKGKLVLSSLARVKAMRSSAGSAGI